MKKTLLDEMIIQGINFLQNNITSPLIWCPVKWQYFKQKSITAQYKKPVDTKMQRTEIILTFKITCICP